MISIDEVIVVRIKELPENLRPREKAIFCGVENVSDVELLSIFFGSGNRNSSVLEMASRVLEICHGFTGLSTKSFAELLMIKGITQLKALEIMTLFEIAKRSMTPNHIHAIRMDQTDKVKQWLCSSIGSSRQENFVAIYLNVRKEMVGYKKLFVGTLDQSLIHPREIFKYAMVHSASSIIIAHNHPAGSQVPSSVDCQVTEQIALGGKLMGIDLVDHLIVTHTECISIRKSHPFLFELNL